MTDTAQQTVSFVVNGTPVSVRAGHPHLLAALREELGITSPKDGCSPSGQCGCCTVMIDGKAQVSCQYPVTRAEGRTVTTLEGVDETERKKYSDAFAACGGLQCGFCIPGIVMRAKSQVDKKGADLKREDMYWTPSRPLPRALRWMSPFPAVSGPVVSSTRPTTSRSVTAATSMT
jgi:aerobic-type carbon monoxide dehydrogenase small subunit (CoxS/CutS family)